MYSGLELKTRLLEDYNPSLSHSGVSGQRLADRLAELSKIGTTKENGSYRIGFSKEEKQAKELVKAWMKEAGLVVTEDGAGNIFGRLEGQDPSKQAILSGSHLDSVPNGGHFDGPLGVLAALEVAEAWKETSYTPECPYEVVIFSDEEGARFNGGFLGSQAMVGELTPQIAELVDVDGKNFEEAVSEVGLTVEGFLSAKRDLSKIKAFIEIHIEQGKRLEKEQLPVGIVTGIAGPCWLDATFRGVAGHAGNTPMTDRKDALVAASEWIQSLSNLPQTISSTAVATVGKLTVYPNGVNVIPGEVHLSADIRDISEDTRTKVVKLAVKKGENIALESGLEFDVRETLKITPVPIEKTMMNFLEKTFHQVSLTPYYLPSGAGHDAMIVGRYIPTAMMFVQSKDGTSHNPMEWSNLNDCITAVHALKALVENLAKEPLNKTT